MIFRMTEHRLLVAVAVALLVSVWARADEKLLRDALRKDDTLGEISGRLDEMVERQEQSSVFQQQEVSKTESTGETIETARSTAMKDVITELSRQLAAQEDQDAAPVLDQTREHYARLLEILRGLKQRNNELEERQMLRDLLKEQEELLAETEQMPPPKQEKATMETIEDFADLAERQEELRQNATAEPIKENMKKAEEALNKMQPEQAAALQRQVIEQLQEKLAAPEQDSQDNDNTSDPMSELAQQINALQKMDERLGKIEDSLRHKDKKKARPEPEYQQQKAMELNEAAKELRDLEQQEAATDAIEAIPPLMQAEWKPAAEEVKEARDKLQKAMALMLQQLQEQAEAKEEKKEDQQQQKQENNQLVLQPGEKNRTQKKAREERDQVQEGRGWLSSLPDRERDAVLSARSARYDARWETEVKRYFVELAK